jgi:triosephosphate isomerase
MRIPFIAGNWKMNGSIAVIKSLLQKLLHKREDFASIEMAVFPPSIYLEVVSQYLQGSPIAWGAQNVYSENSGAYTGEISCPMLKEFDCRYVIVGHSERRILFGETDRQVAAKFTAALKADLRPILCVGETAEERENGKTLNVIERQLAAALELTDNLPNLSQAVIAYEPVWAIGTGQNATAAQAQEVHQAIRSIMEKHQNQLGEKVRIIYGGSVKAENAAKLLSEADIDGVLVGGASLQAEQFIEIAKQCKH